jgi:hypothetical protein
MGCGAGRGGDAIVAGAGALDGAALVAGVAGLEGAALVAGAGLDGNGATACCFASLVSGTGRATVPLNVLVIWTTCAWLTRSGFNGMALRTTEIA